MTLTKAITLFLTNRAKRGCNQGTLQSYKSHLTLTAQWLAKQKTSKVEKLTASILNQYIEHLRKREKQTSPTTIRQRATAIRTFLRWSQESEIITDNQAKGLIIPKKPRRLPRSLHPDHIRIIIKTKLSNRDRAILYLMLDSGLRRAEVSQLKLDDLDLIRGIAHVQHGKGDRERYVIFAKKTTEALHQWLKKRNAQPNVKEVFTSKHGRAIQPGGIYKIVKRAAHRAGIQTNAHRLRHTFATNYLDQGGSIHDLQMLLGHEEITTTMIYVSVSVEHLRKKHKKLSLLDNLLKHPA